jgi:hypothetical protein
MGKINENDRNTYEPHGGTVMMQRIVNRDEGKTNVDTLPPVDRPLKKIRVVVWLVFSVQLLILVLEANTIYSRGELTLDYAVFGPAFTSIGHLSLNPHVFMPDGRGIAPFLGNHFEWITWPLALIFEWILRIPTWVTLLIFLQAIPTALVGTLGSYYAISKSEKQQLSNIQLWMVALLPSLLAATNIWLYWDDRFDFHFQALQGCLTIGIILALESEHEFTALALGIVLMGTGETAAILFLPIVTVLLLQRKVKFSIVATVAALLTLVAPRLFGVLTQDNSAFSFAYHYLNPSGPPPQSMFEVVKLIILHPGVFLGQVWGHRLDVWSELASTGFIGLASPIAVIGIIGLGVPAWSASFGGFAGPIFQTIGIVQIPIFMSGVVMLLLIRKSWRWGRVLSIAAVLWSLIWLLVFGPLLVRQLTQLSSTQVGHETQILNSVIPASDVVLSTNATLGDFPNHVIEEFGCTPSIQLPHARVVIVVDPWKGLQTCGPYELLRELSRLAALPGATISGPGSDGLFVVRVDATHLRNRKILVGRNQPLTGNFLIAPGAQHGHLVQDVKGNYLVSEAGKQFVEEGVVADLKPFHAGKVVVKLSIKGSSSIQVWNDASGVELAQANLTSNSIEAISLSFNTGRFVRPPLFSEGVGLFSTKLIPPLPLNPIEVRVSSPSGSDISVYSVLIQ